MITPDMFEGYIEEAATVASLTNVVEEACAEYGYEPPERCWHEEAAEIADDCPDLSIILLLAGDRWDAITEIDSATD